MKQFLCRCLLAALLLQPLPTVFADEINAQIASLDSNGLTLTKLPMQMLSLQVVGNGAELVNVRPRLVNLPYSGPNPNFKPKAIEGVPAPEHTLLLIDDGALKSGQVRMTSQLADWSEFALATPLSKQQPSKSFPVPLPDRRYVVVIACGVAMLRDDGWPIGTQQGARGPWFSQDFSVPCELSVESGGVKQSLYQHTYTYRDVRGWTGFASNWQLLWSGDLDRDDGLDMVWKETENPPVTWTLWLSGSRVHSPLVGKYASFVAYLPQDCSEKRCDD